MIEGPLIFYHKLITTWSQTTKYKYKGECKFVQTCCYNNFHNCRKYLMLQIYNATNSVKCVTRDH